MRIVELGDNSMSIMGDSEDPPWAGVGEFYRLASRCDRTILVDLGDQLTFEYIESHDYIYSAHRLVLFFEESIPKRFHLHDRVGLWLKDY